MALCAFCKVEETMLYEGGVPVCLKCADPSPERLRARVGLFHDLNEAVRRTEAATEAFSAITSRMPSGNASSGQRAADSQCLLRTHHSAKRNDESTSLWR